MKIPEGEFQGEYTGKRDGDELYFRQNKFARPNIFSFKMAEPKIATLMGPHLYSLDGQLFYINEPAPELAADRAIWGVYLDLIDKTWQLKGAPEGVPKKFKFRWLIPGKVVAEIGYGKSGKHMPDAVRHVRALPNGKLLAVMGEWTHLFAAEGTLLPNGNIEFKPLKKRMFSFEWAYQSLGDGTIRMPWTVTKDVPVFVPITPEEEKEIQDIYDQQKWAEIQRKRARLESFIDFTNAMGGTLSEAQHVADVSAAQSRANLDATLARIQANQRSTQQSSEPAVTRPSPTVSSSLPAAPASATPAAIRSTSTSDSRNSSVPSAHREDSSPQLFPTPEAVVVCTKPDADGRFECDTPVDVNRRGGPKNELEAWKTPESAIIAMNASCPQPTRLASTTHFVWGCGFGATGNSNSMDRSAGVDVKGRQTFYCYRKEVGCRKTAP
jgi:hypothetical protein